MADDKPELFAGKRALVTGGASGIGRATALLLAERGADVLIVDLNDASELCGSAVGGKIASAVFDLAESAAIPGFIQSEMRARGPIDILVNCAAYVGNTNLVLKTTEAEWDLAYNVNIKAPFLLIREVAAEMIRVGIEGKIVNVSSSSAFRARFTAPHYATSKAALVQLTRTCAAEFGPYGINVNAVAPGLTATALSDSQLADGQLEGRDYDALVAGDGPLANLLHRVSRPQDVAEAILFLALPAARQITGQTIHTSAGAVV